MTIFSGDNAMVLKNIQTSPFACLKIFDFIVILKPLLKKNKKTWKFLAKARCHCREALSL